MSSRSSVKSADILLTEFCKSTSVSSVFSALTEAAALQSVFSGFCE